MVDLGNGLRSTAAGRYQLLSRYFDYYKNLLKLADFGHASQDAIALQQIKERGALPDIDAGDLETAIRKVRNIWASMPGAGYGQHENTLARLEGYYRDAGGSLA